MIKFSSSLQRIERTTQSIETGLEQLKIFLRRAETGNLHAKAPLLSSSAVEVSARIQFNEQCMKAAEVSQRWFAIGIDEWLNAGMWWLLMAKTDLRIQHPLVESGGQVSQEGYVNLLKASWILTDIIVVHPQFGYIEASTQYEIMQLTEVSSYIHST